MKGNPRYRVSDEGDIIDAKRNRELNPIFDRNMQKWIVDTTNPQGGHSRTNIAKAVLEAFSGKDEKIVSKNIIYIDGDVNNYHLSNLTYKPKRTYEQAKAYQREYARRKAAEEKEKKQQLAQPTQADKPKIHKKERIHKMYVDWTEALEQRLATEDLTPFQYWCVTSTIEANKKILQKYGQGTNKDR